MKEFEVFFLEWGRLRYVTAIPKCLLFFLNLFFKMVIKHTLFELFLSVQVCNIKYTYIVVQLSPPSSPELFQVPHFS